MKVSKKAKWTRLASWPLESQNRKGTSVFTSGFALASRCPLSRNDERFRLFSIAQNRHHRDYFKQYLKHAMKLKRVHPALLDFDLDKLAQAIQFSAMTSSPILDCKLFTTAISSITTTPSGNTADFLDARRDGTGAY